MSSSHHADTAWPSQQPAQAPTHLCISLLLLGGGQASVQVLLALLQFTHALKRQLGHLLGCLACGVAGDSLGTEASQGVRAEA